MKKLLIIAIILTASQFGFSQFKFGVVGSYAVSLGEQSSKIYGTPTGRKAMEIAFLESKNLPSIGISLGKDFGPLFVNTEVHYRRNAYTLRIQNFLKIDEPMKYLEETSSVINVPITAGVKVGNLRLGVGPIFNFQTGQNNDQVSIYNIEEKKRVLQTGFSGSIGLDVGSHIRLGLKYEHAFSKVGDDYKYSERKLPLNSRLNYLTMSAGFFF